MTVLAAAYVFVPPFKGYALVDQRDRPVVTARDRGRHAAAPPARRGSPGRCCSRGSCSTSPATSTRIRYPDLLGGTVGFPSAGDAMYLAVYPSCSRA